jgi:hypothetical protein
MKVLILVFSTALISWWKIAERLTVGSVETIVVE